MNTTLKTTARRATQTMLFLLGVSLAMAAIDTPEASAQRRGGFDRETTTTTTRGRRGRRTTTTTTTTNSRRNRRGRRTTTTTTTRGRRGHQTTTTTTRRRGHRTTHHTTHHHGRRRGHRTTHHTTHRTVHHTTPRRTVHHRTVHHHTPARTTRHVHHYEPARTTTVHHVHHDRSYRRHRRNRQRVHSHSWVRGDGIRVLQTREIRWRHGRKRVTVTTTEFLSPWRKRVTVDVHRHNGTIKHTTTLYGRRGRVIRSRRWSEHPAHYHNHYTTTTYHTTRW